MSMAFFRPIEDDCGKGWVRVGAVSEVKVQESVKEKSGKGRIRTDFSFTAHGSIAPEESERLRRAFSPVYGVRMGDIGLPGVYRIAAMENEDGSTSLTVEPANEQTERLLREMAEEKGSGA